MSTPRSYIVLARARRNILKHIRGYQAELTDSPVADALDPANPPPAIPYTGDENGGWQRPRLSAAIPAIGGEKLCMWGIWRSQTTPATRQAFIDKAAEFPNLIRWWAQQGTLVGEEFTESETLDAFKARVKGVVGWIDAPLTGG